MLRPRAWFPWALIFAAAVAAYFPALRGGLVWNDIDYVTRADLQSLHGLWRIWFQLGATEQYYPVLHSAFWLEHRAWGAAPLGYHLANVLLHATAAGLFALILRRLWAADLGARAAGAAWLAAFLFVLHPVCVESVAWISEQKNTLSLVLYLAAAAAYLRWDEERGRTTRRGALLYAAALGCFLLAVLSKSVTATLPAALLVVAWWRRGALGWRRDVVPLLPWFAAGAAAGVFTAWVEHTLIGAQGGDFLLTPAQRVLVAGRVVWFYLGKLAWPAHLVFIYPRWRIDAAAPGAYLYPLSVLGALIALWLFRGRARGPLAAALLFVGGLFPLLGFFNIYAFVFSFVADHFQYLACLSLIALAASAWRWSGRAPALFGLGAGLILAVLAVLTWRQCGQYRDVVTFYRTIARDNPAAWLAHNNLAGELRERGRLNEAAAEFSTAADLRPGDARIQCNLGAVLMDEGKPAEAAAHYEAALRINPGDAEARNNLGNVLAQSGRLPEAMAQYEAALQIDPNYADAHFNLSSLLTQLDRLPEAIGHLQAARIQKPGSVDIINNLANACLRADRFAEAIGYYEEALRLDPARGDVRANLAVARRTQAALAPAAR